VARVIAPLAWALTLALPASAAAQAGNAASVVAFPYIGAANLPGTGPNP